MADPIKPTVTTGTATTNTVAVADPTKKATVVASAPVAQRAFTITSFDDDEDENEDYLNMLIYAPYGVGKTTLMGSACDVPEMCDVLILDFESGKMTLKKNPRVKNLKAVDVIRITNFKQLGKVHEFMKAHCRLRDEPSKEKELIALEAKFKGVPADSITKPRRYRTVGIDSLSELDTLSMYELLGISSDANLETVMNDGNPDTAEFKEYKQNNQMMQLVIRAYRDLPVNCIFICHAGFLQNEQKQMIWSPALTGKLGKQAQGFVDVVGYLVAGTVTASTSNVKGEAVAPEIPRRLWLQPAGKFDAKCRIASFKQTHLDNPVMKDVWTIMQK